MFFLFVFLAALGLPATALAQSVGGYGPNWGPGSNVSYGWNGGGYGGYGWYGGWGFPHCSTGVKFDLDRLSRQDRKAVLAGTVVIDDFSDEGIVDRYDGWTNGVLPLAPGQHSVSIRLSDNRRADTVVFVQPCRVSVIYPRLREMNEAVPSPSVTPTPPATSPQTAPAPPTTAPAIPNPPVATPPATSPSQRPAVAAQPTCLHGSVGGYGPNSGPCSNVVRASVAGVGP